jgi:hypothetical protein
MALQGSGTIKMSEIAEEKKGSGLPAGGYWQNISLRGLSVDSVTDFSYYNGDSIITADYPGTPNSAQPHGMAEFYGYSQFSWGSPSTPSTNVAYIFNKDTENLNANNATAATTVNIRHLVANKRIDFFFINTVDGGPGTTHTTDQESVFYTGTLSNLEARFAFNTMDLSRDDASGSGDAVLGQAFDTSGQIDASDVSANGTSVTGATTVNSLNSNAGQNQTFNSAWGNIGTDNNIDKSAMLYVSAQGGGQTGTFAEIASGGVGTLAIQLRANQDNNSIVTLYTRTGTFDLQVYSYEDDTT